MTHLLSLVLLTILLPMTALAAVHKCRGPGGQPMYQDKPCMPGEELRNLGEDPPNVSVIPFARPPPSPAAKPERTERAERPPKRSAKPGPTFDAAERRHLKEGMSEGEVAALLGPPDQRGRSGRNAQWTYLPAPRDPQTVTVILFEQGRVARVERRIRR